MSRLGRLVLGLLVVVGCGSIDETSDGEAESSTTPPSQVATTMSQEPAPDAPTLSSGPTTAVYTTTTVGSPATSDAAESGAVLEADGLGLVRFGALFDEAVATLESALGPATLSERVEPNSPSMTEFHVYWEEAGLHIGFSTHPFFRSDGELHFTWWHTWATPPPPRPLRTALGVGWGSTLSDLEDAYGDRFWLHDDVCAPPGIIVPKGDISGGTHDESGQPRWIFVAFDQPDRWNEEGSRYLVDPDSARVVGMETGASDGC